MRGAGVVIGEMGSVDIDDEDGVSEDEDSVARGIISPNPSRDPGVAIALASTTHLVDNTHIHTQSENSKTISSSIDRLLGQQPRSRGFKDPYSMLRGLRLLTRWLNREISIFRAWWRVGDLDEPRRE